MKTVLKNYKAQRHSAILKQSVIVILCFLLIQFLPNTGQAQNFRASASAGAASGISTLTISKPAGTISSDIMIAAVSVRPYNAVITAPAGWTLIRKTVQSSGNTSSQATYWKAAGASEPSSYSWSFSASQGTAGGISTFYNINTANPVNIENGHATASGLSHTTQSITTTLANTMVISTHSFASSASWTSPAGMTECVDKYSDASRNSVGTSIQMNYAVQAAAGATGTKTATASNDADYGVAQIMALVKQTATIAYSGSPYCSNSGTASVTHTGTTGGTYSSTAGLSINSTSGLVDLSTSTPGTYTVTYTYGGSGTATASITITASPSPYAIRFDGTNDYITMTNNLTANFTIEAWIKTSATSNTGTQAWQGNALFWGDVPGISNDFTLSILNNKLAFDDGSANNATTAGSKILNDNIWHHVAVVRTAGSPGTVKLYVDGVQDGSTGTAGSSTLNANPVISIGGYSGGARFNGYMDEVRMWNTTRTAAQISANKSGNLVGNEAGLSNYFRFDEGVGSTANNSVSGPADGTLINISAAAATGPTSTSGWVTAGFSYSASAYCSNSGAQTITLASNHTAGTFSASPAGLSLNTSTGAVTLSSSTAGTYTVTNTTTGYNGCSMLSFATITVVAAPSATISYSGSPYCSSVGSATVTTTGTAGGTFSSASGLSIDASTGAVDLNASTAGTYTVTYTITATGTCAAFTTTTAITITTQPNATGSYPGTPYCSNSGTAIPSGSAAGAIGTFSSAAGLSLDQYYGTVNVSASTAGTYTVTYTVPASGGCALYTRTTPITITAAPSATIGYSGSPYCPAGTATVTRTGTSGGTYSSTAGLSLNTATGDINLSASTAGTYTVTYTIAATSPCAQFQTSASVTINPSGTWTGTNNTNWNAAANWQCGVIPSATTNVTIPSGLFNYPVINNLTAMTNNITIQSGATVTITNGTLQIAGTAATGGGKITATSGKVEFNGTAAQTIPANFFSSNTVKDLVITNAAGVSLAGAVRVTNTVDFGSVNNSVLTSNGFLTLVSTSTNSANLTDLTNGGVNTGNSVSGNVTVERFIQGRRAYRFLTAPVNSTTSIKANWMENTNNPSTSVNNNPVPNYGTHITGTGGSANGFDQTTTNNTSLFTFNVGTQTWVPAANTNGLFAAGNGFRIMVRGSRGVNLNDNYSGSSATTLRASGTLVTGDVRFTKTGGGGTTGMPALSTVTGGYSYIANPYPSSVNWLSILAGMTDVGPTMYIFDPTITGSNGRGGYVSYNGILKVKSILTSLLSNDIQSGQGFFVQSTGPNPSLTFKETYKSSTFLPVFRTANDVPHLSVELLLPAPLNNAGAADGLSVYFSDDYNSAIGDDDSYKFTNQDENIAILRNGTALSLEGRKPVIGTDSVPLKMWQLTQKNYTLRITLDKFGNNIHAFLEDKFLHTSSPLGDGETLVPFDITSDAASNAADRFKVVFQSLTTLPVKLTNIKAYEKSKGVQVEWTAESESNMERYEVERSANAQQFEPMASVKAKNNSGVSTTYSYFDVNPNNGDDYYRIKSVEKSGDVTYSGIVKVHIAAAGTISVYPNPITGNTINVAFTNKEKGSYFISLLNSTGQRVYAGTVNHDGGSASHVVNVSSALPKGVYQLLISSGNNAEKISIFVR